jgi:hypothetical protein
MSDSGDAINSLITNITGVVETQVCDKIPAMIDQKSQQIFDQVISILSTKREQLRDNMMNKFKESMATELLNDKTVKDMLVSILKEGTEKVFEVKSVPISQNQVPKTGGKKTKKRKPISKKYRKSVRKI